jgi:glucose/arabinose dehydrogenase
LFAQDPTVVDRNLSVSTVVSGLTTPISMAFLDRNDFLIAEKSTGRVRRVLNGVL